MAEPAFPVDEQGAGDTVVGVADPPPTAGQGICDVQQLQQALEEAKAQVECHEATAQAMAHEIVQIHAARKQAEKQVPCCARR